MNRQSDNTQESQRQSVGGDVSKEKVGRNSVLEFADDRPETNSQRMLQKMADNSSQVKQLKAVQQMADNSLGTKQATGLTPKSNSEQLDGNSEIIQRKVGWQEAETRNRYRPDKNDNIKSSVYLSQYEKVSSLEKRVTIVETEGTNQGEGAYSRSESALLGPQISIHPLEGAANEENQHFNDNISTLAHEFQHALDDLGAERLDAFNLETGAEARWNIIHTEWRAWAIQAAVNFELAKGKSKEAFKVNKHQQRMLESFLNPKEMTLISDEFFRKTRVYINKHVFKDTGTEYSEKEVQIWMIETGKGWLEESVALFNSKIDLGEEEAEAIEIVEEAVVPLTIEKIADLDKLAPGLGKGGVKVIKVRRDDTYKIYSFNDILYRLSPEVVGSGQFDNASGSWA